MTEDISVKYADELFRALRDIRTVPPLRHRANLTIDDAYVSLQPYRPKLQEVSTEPSAWFSLNAGLGCG
jgi:hypothetical protein